MINHIDAIRKINEPHLQHQLNYENKQETLRNLQLYINSISENISGKVCY